MPNNEYGTLAARSAERSAMITEAHRKKAFSLMAQISDHCGYESKGQFYTAVIKPAYNKAYDIDFSLKAGECTLDEYDRFLEFVLDIALDVGVQFSQSPKNCFNSVERYLILCIKNRVCCLTGQSGADLHHAVAIGAGMDRDDVDHSKYPRMSLCREKHTECHQIGQAAFDKKYFVHGVLCNYHNDVFDDEEPPLVLAHQNINKIAYSDEKRLVGVKFKQPVPGCNEKNLIYYRMAPEEWGALSGTPNIKQAFMELIYGQRKIVDI